MIAESILAVVQAVAEAEGVEPIDLPPLADAIDPDSLERLASKNHVQVRFTYHDYRVSVDGKSGVHLEPVDGSSSQRAIDAHRILATAREGMSLVGIDGTFRFVNSAFANVFGYDREELVGEHWTVLYHDGEAKRLAEDILPAVREVGYWSGETVRLTKDGEPRVTEHRLALTDEDLILCTATDVTLDRTGTGSYYSQTEVMVDEIENSAFFTLDHEGYVTRWNESSECLNGYESGDILGRHFSVFFSRCDRNRPEELLERAKHEGRVTDEMELVRNNRTRCKVDMTIYANYDDAGTLQGFGTRIRNTEIPSNS